MRVSCPDCGREISAADVNIQAAIARCLACDAVFSVLDRGESAPAEEAAGLAGEAIRRELVSRRKREGDLPRGFREVEESGEFVIERPWRGARTVPLLIFSVVWCTFLVLWFRTAMERPAPGSYVLLAFAAIHGLVGLVLVYTALAHLVNTTTMRANTHEIRVRHAPVPWPGSRSLSAHDVDQLFVRARRRRRKHRGRFSESLSHELWAALRTGDRISILGNLGTEEQALWLEERIEAELGIQNRPVGDAG